MENFYAQRRQRLQQRLQEQGISTAIVNSPVNIYYLTGKMLNPVERYVGLVLDEQAERPHLVLPLMEKDDQLADVEEIGYLDTQKPLSLVAQVLNKRGKIGVEKPFISFGRMEELSHYAGLKWEDYGDIGGILTDLRLHKDQLEIANHQKAADITCDILLLTQERLNAGCHDQDVLYFINQQVWQHPDLEGVSFDTQVSSGLKTCKAHGVPGDHVLTPGQQLVIDFGVSYHYYKSDITRTFFAGSPPAKLEDLYRITLEAQMAAIETVRPGRPICEVDRAARQVIEKAGYGEYFNHRTGHGLGLEIHEPPDISHVNRDVLEEGMIFTIEPGIYLPEIGGVRVEDDILVTAEGCHVITTYNKKLADVTIS